MFSAPIAQRRIGSRNFGGFSSTHIDELLHLIQSEADDATHQPMPVEGADIVQNKTAHVQLRIWETKANIELTHQSDKSFVRHGGRSIRPISGRG